MKLFVNDTAAKKGMKVQTFRGEKAILLDWYEPGTVSGGNGGRVRIKETGGCEGTYFPGVIGAKFE